MKPFVGLHPGRRLLLVTRRHPAPGTSLLPSPALGRRIGIPIRGGAFVWATRIEVNGM
jgi:hypothetical protein